MTKSTGNSGLTSIQAKELQTKFGKNELSLEKKQSLFRKVLIVLSEPMFLLLLVSALIYFFLGEPRDGAIMLIFVLGMITIDIFQELKTDKTINTLKDLSAPKIQVIRDDKECLIDSFDLVPGDLMIVYEGTKIPADGFIVRCNDLSVNESTLTGEAEAVWKNEYISDVSTDYWRKDYVYAGTLVVQGSGYICVDKIGLATQYGKIGKNISEIVETPTPLQKQTKALVKTCTIIALFLLLLVAIITWFNVSNLPFTKRLISSILSGITLAMAMIPEEFPVILTVFLSLGAWRLAKKNSLVRKLPSVETLGAVSVLCVDKTGTITQNEMQVQDLWLYQNNHDTLLKTLGMACEYPTYDPMEEAILEYCWQNGLTSDVLFSNLFIDEYSFTNESKMMGHIWQTDKIITLCAKGSPEAILKISNLSSEQIEVINEKIFELSSMGLRLLAIGSQDFKRSTEIPPTIYDCQLEFLGLVALIDPPRPQISKDIEVCKKAGIRVVMITGDSGITAKSIAKKIGMETNAEVMTGEEIEQLSDEQLQMAIKTTNIFSRVIPEHKMRIVKAFKENGEIVAMSGDGVNDAPALKIADIGIAMGKRGSEVSREAADLILMDDNFSTIIDTIKDGRRIYENIKKAINYVFTIHLPIALSALLAPLLKIDPSALLLLPIHVVLLELVIDPTCSIVLERQPEDDDIMERAPRHPRASLLTKGLLFKSILQGFIMFLASFGTYYYYYKTQANPILARSMGLTILILANLFLVYVNSSTHESILHSLKKLKQDKVMLFSAFLTLAMVGIILYSPLHIALKLIPLTFTQLGLAFIIAAISVLWWELVKIKLNK